MVNMMRLFTMIVIVIINGYLNFFFYFILFLPSVFLDNLYILPITILLENFKQLVMVSIQIFFAAKLVIDILLVLRVWVIRMVSKEFIVIVILSIQTYSHMVCWVLKLDYCQMAFSNCYLRVILPSLW